MNRTQQMTAAEARAYFGSNTPPKAQSRPVSAVPPVSAPITPLEPERSTESRKQQQAEAQRPAALKPRFAVALHEGYEGKRFVATGLTTEQARSLCIAAEGLGILEQQ